jgi:putative transposase
MDLRVRLIQEYEAGEDITALGELYGVSRKTIYKWIDRYAAEGVGGLADRSRAPHYRPQRVSEEMTRQIIAARQRWKWGPRKLLIKLEQIQPEVNWPAASTMGDVLQRAGLSHPRRKRLRTPLQAGPFAVVEQPNQTWCADFKGWFHTGDGTRCDPLTISDAHSRYLLRCQIVGKTDTLHVEAIFDAAFHEYGLPQVIHTDNGAPFASCAPAGLSRLSMRWVKLGITPERSRPASPQDNGRHERMHLTLKQDTLQPPAETARQQQEVFARFQHTYNQERPHEALKDCTPASCYQSSWRCMPRRVPELEYDNDVVLRRVSHSGEVKWKNQDIFVSKIFAHEVLGLRPLNERYFQLCFGPVVVGWIDGYRHRFHRSLGVRLKRELGLM